MKFKIFAVEDLEEYRLLIESSLDSNIYKVSFATNGKQALEMIQKESYDLFLIDIMLPDMSGLQICNFIKSQEHLKHLPVIFLTSKDTADDLAKGFDVGADDYIKKPFHFKELNSRLQARLKSPQQNTVDRLKIENIEVDLNQHRVHVDGKSIELTPIEYRLFVYFIKHIDHVLSRDKILQAVWPNQFHISERTVDTHISNLRKKLPLGSLQLTSVHGSGYRISLWSKAS